MQEGGINRDNPGDFATRFAVQADLIRQSGLLGRSDPLRRLLDYLISRAGSTEAPKEIEIAEALGREYSFEAGLDGSIRVYVHRLRKKLDEFYAKQSEGGDRLSIPRGAYRLSLETLDMPSSHVAPMSDALAVDPGVAAMPIDKGSRRSWLLFPAGMLAMLCLVAAAVSVYRLTLKEGGPASQARLVEQLAATAMWHPFAGYAFRSIYVVGDQPLEGGHPHVLMMGSAKALVELVPVMDSVLCAKARSSLTGTSFLSPSSIKDANIVFIGAFTQMGVLRNAVFGRSGFVQPDLTGTLIDKVSGRRYASAPPPYIDHGELTSYGYLASLTGPSGNRIVVISGATDGAVVQVAEVALDPTQLDALAAKGGGDFEALYSVVTLDGEAIAHHLDTVRPLAPLTR